MNISVVSSENVTCNGIVLRENNQEKLWQVYNLDGWSKNSKFHQEKSLAFLPILGFIIFIICSLLKAYKWSRDTARWKARGGMEFGDEVEVNYGIIKAGDKGFCQVDILSDGASVYDTVNSYRFLGNGYASQMADSYPYNDTVTSYKSLLAQKADGNQYDSIRSYKGFLQKVAQSKDLDVEVKLLERYPVCSRHTEHSSEMVSARISSSISLKKQSSKDGLVHQFENKRRRRASGDVSTIKKRPSSRWVTSPVNSCSSARQTFSFSGDSEEDCLQMSRVDQRMCAVKRKKIPQSSSSTAVMAFPGSSCHSVPCARSTNGSVNIPKRRRHYSADSIRHLKRAAINRSSHKYSDLMNSINIAAGITLIMEIKPASVQVTKSLEKSDTSHSSHVDVSVDTLVSSTDISKVLPLSIVSNGHILENDVLVSLSSAVELQSVSEVTETPITQSLSETKTLIAHAREEFFKNKLNSAFSLKAKETVKSQNPDTTLGSINSSNLSKAKITPVDLSQTSTCENHSMCVSDKVNLNLQCIELPSLESSTRNSPVNRKASFLPLSKSHSEMETNMPESVSNGITEPATKCNLYKVQRFHVTYVNAKVSSLLSDSPKSS